MKKILCGIVMLLVVMQSFAAFTVPSSKTPVPVESKEQAQRLLMEQIVQMSVKDYEVMTGKKMRFFDRLAFKATKSRFEHQLKRAEAETSGFNIGGFLLGFFLGLLGVLLAYIFSQDSNLRKWSWIGVGTVVALSLIIALLA